MERSREWVLLVEDVPNKVHLLQADLELAGIETRITDEEVAVTMPFLQPTIRLFVLKEQAERAKEMWEDFQQKWEEVEEEMEREAEREDADAAETEIKLADHHFEKEGEAEDQPENRKKEQE